MPIMCSEPNYAISHPRIIPEALIYIHVQLGTARIATLFRVSISSCYKFAGYNLHTSEKNWPLPQVSVGQHVYCFLHDSRVVQRIMHVVCTMNITM